MTVLVTSISSLGFFIICFFVALRSSDLINYHITSSDPTSYNSIGSGLPQPDMESSAFYHASNIVNGGLGCFDGSRYYFSDRYLWSEDVSGDNSNSIYDRTVYYINSVGEHLYFVSPSENYAICRIKKDGTEFKKIYDKYCYELTYYDGWLYFSSDFGDSDLHICRMRPDGSNLTILANCRVWYMTLYNDKIYFCNYDDGKSICSMNIDGSEYKLLRSGECCDLCIVNNKIYFSTNMEYRNLHSIDINGNNEEVLINSYVRNTNYYNKKLYFVNLNGEICSCDLNGNNICVLLSDSTYYSYITLLPGKICCWDSRNDVLKINDA